MISTLIKLPMEVTFGQWLKLNRENAGKSQAELAKELNISRSAVGNWETGLSVPSLPPGKISKLCSILGVSFEELVKASEGTMRIVNE